MYHIVTELEARGMPLELALLPVVESAFEPFAYSRARAAGLWQFIPGTGTRFGLKQNWWYDGRRDVVESTRARSTTCSSFTMSSMGTGCSPSPRTTAVKCQRCSRHRQQPWRRANPPTSGA